jgi:Domain of unknown function (DUF1707)
LSFGGSEGPHTLASDAEREHVAVVLRDAAGEGRLTADELTDRLGLALKARTSGELEALTRDLPVALGPTPGALAGPTRSLRFLFAVLSGTNRRGRLRLERHCALITVMGGANLDLRDAEIVGSRVEIYVLSVMSGVKILVPEGVFVQLDGLSVMGGKTAKIADVPIRPGAPEIHVHALSVMGGTSVRSARPPKQSKRKWIER